MISRTSTRAHSTNDIMGQHDRDEDKARHAGTNMSIKRRTTQSLASTSISGADYVTRQTMRQIREWDGHYRRYKYYMWVIKTSVFKLISRMQAMIFMLISACILSMVKSTPTMLNKEHRLSKYKTQLFDCEVPGKI